MSVIDFITSNGPAIGGGIGILVVFFIIMSGYVKASPDKAYIISGARKTPKILIGKAGIKIPFLDKKDELLLKQISVDIKTNGYIPTKDFIGVDIDAIAKVRILTYADVTVDKDGNHIPGTREDMHVTKEMVQAAMKNFLNMEENEICSALQDSLQGNMREIIGTQDLKSLCNDRKKFGDEVQEKAQKDMNELGIWIVSCNIQKLTDEKELILALGQDNMSQIQKSAAIAKAEALRDQGIAEAKADKEKNDARVAADLEIAQKKNELKIKESELKKEADRRSAEADAAYKLEDAKQRKEIGIADTEAEIAKQEREIDLKAKEAQVKEQELAASIKKEADAKKYQTEKESEADLYRRQKEADAQKYEEEKQAEITRVRAEAARYEKQQQAEGIAAVGRAEAEAIQAKGIAEAEAMEKKAEAMSKYGQAAIIEMIAKQLPAIAESAAKPFGDIDNFTVIGGDTDGNSISGLTSKNIAATREIVNQLLGVDIAELVKAGTYDAKVNRNLNITGLENHPAEIKVGQDGEAEIEVTATGQV